MVSLFVVYWINHHWLVHATHRVLNYKLPFTNFCSGALWEPSHYLLEQFLCIQFNSAVINMSKWRVPTWKIRNIKLQKLLQCVKLELVKKIKDFQSPISYLPNNKCLVFLLYKCTINITLGTMHHWREYFIPNTNMPHKIYNHSYIHKTNFE